LILLLDIGNTRLKWAYAEAGVIVAHGAEAHQGQPADCLSRLDLDEPESVRVCSVAGAANDLALTKVCVARWQQSPKFARAEAERQGLRSAYAEPARLGVDRWLAMLAGWRLAGGACVVADAGTALTIDVIDGQGRHQGGVIAAGLHTSEKAVLGATRFATRTTPLPVHAGLGQDTEACVRQGAMLSVLGALDRAAALAPGVPRYLAGGDAPALIDALTGWEHRPLLVFEGLLFL
jgi:type III pantothenate kinase